MSKVWRPGERRSVGKGLIGLVRLAYAIAVRRDADIVDSGLGWMLRCLRW